MTFALHVYRVLTSALSPFLGFVLSARVKQGKEDFSRRNERMARHLPVLRNNGVLVWLHGASVGESRLLLELGNRLLDERPDLMLLFTSQTQTSAKLMGPMLPDNAVYTMAPVDTPAAARRRPSTTERATTVLLAARCASACALCTRHARGEGGGGRGAQPPQP